MTYSTHIILAVVHVITLMDLKQNQVSQCGSINDCVENSPDSATKHPCMDLGSRTYSTSAIHLTTLSSTPTSRHQSKPKGYNSEDNLCEQFPEVEFSRNRQHVSKPNSLESSRNASSNSSPLNLKGSSERVYGRSESLSSEDMVLSRDTPALPRDTHISHSTSAILSSNSKQDSSLHRSSSVSYDIPQRSYLAHSYAGRQQSASPGSEMVTLEEFLEESNGFSPLNRQHSLSETEIISLHQFLLEADALCPSCHFPSHSLHQEPSHSVEPVLSHSRGDNVRHRTGRGSRRATLLYFPRDAFGSRDELLSDYFRKANEPLPIGNQVGQSGRKEAAKMPTSYVSPTIKKNITSEEGRVAKPGHYVKPNLRPVEPEPLSNSTGSLKLPPTAPHQPLSGVKQMAQPQHTSTMSQRNASLSRAFSLASADLLKATGPEMYRQESSQKLSADVCVGKDLGSQTVRLSVPPGSHPTIRDRPQSAKAAGALQGVDSRCRQLDVRRLSLAAPKEERPLSFHQFSASAAASANSVQERVSAVPGQHYSPTQYTPAKVKSKPASRSGEVATVIPVRAASSNTESEGTQGPSLNDALNTKCQSRSLEGHAGAGAIEESNRGGSSKSTPGSPDPHGDQQTVWYEYGCV